MDQFPPLGPAVVSRAGRSRAKRERTCLGCEKYIVAVEDTSRWSLSQTPRPLRPITPEYVHRFTPRVQEQQVAPSGRREASCSRAAFSFDVSAGVASRCEQQYLVNGSDPCQAKWG